MLSVICGLFQDGLPDCTLAHVSYVYVIVTN